jgi:hypothetical protein
MLVALRLGASLGCKVEKAHNCSTQIGGNLRVYILVGACLWHSDWGKLRVYI